METTPRLGFTEYPVCLCATGEQAASGTLKPGMQDLGKDAMQPDDRQSRREDKATSDAEGDMGSFCVCPVCGGGLIEIRHKLICSQCHAICETCCEGGRG